MTVGPTFQSLLVRASVDATSGILTARRQKLKRLFCLERGWLVHAASNLVEEQFLEVLLRWGILQEHERSVLGEDTRKLGTVTRAILARQLVPAEALTRAMEKMIGDLVDSTLEWPEGAFSLEEGRPSLEGQATARCSPIHLLLAHSRRFPASLDALRVRLGPPDVRFGRAPDSDRVLSSIQLDPALQSILDDCDTGSPINQLASFHPDGPEAAFRGVYGLELCGVLRPSTGPAYRSTEPMLERDECLNRLGVPADADHYTVLGIDRTSSQSRVREAYYALARRYHPDRLRGGPLKDLVPLAETFFTRVTDAYNTLWNPALREEYDRQAASPKGAAEPARSDTGYLARQNYLKARALAERKRYADAVTFLENAIQLDANQPEYHLQLGAILASNPRRRQEAERHVRRAIELSPASAHAYVILGHLLRRSGRKLEATAMYKEALRWSPEDAEASAALAAVETGAPPPDEGGFLKAVFKG